MQYFIIHFQEHNKHRQHIEETNQDTLPDYFQTNFWWTLWKNRFVCISKYVWLFI